MERVLLLLLMSVPLLLLNELSVLLLGLHVVFMLVCTLGLRTNALRAPIVNVNGRFVEQVSSCEVVCGKCCSALLFHHSRCCAHASTVQKHCVGRNKWRHLS